MHKFAHILALVSGLALAACATAPPTERVVTRDVVLAVRSPCPAEADIPPAPKQVHDEHPVMPRNAVPTPKELADANAWISWLKGEVDAGHARERILAGKVLEDRTYIEKSQGVMRACAKPGPQSP